MYYSGSLIEQSHVTVKVQVESEKWVGAETRVWPHIKQQHRYSCVYEATDRNRSLQCVRYGDITPYYHRLRMKEGEMSHWSKQKDKRPLEKNRVIQWLCFETDFSVLPTKHHHKENSFWGLQRLNNVVLRSFAMKLMNCFNK